MMKSNVLKDYLFEKASDERSSNVQSGLRRWVNDPWFLLLLRIVLAMVFIYAAMQKIGKPLLFADEIRMYEVLSKGPILYATAIALPWIELFCGFSLLSGIFMRGSALILLVLSSVFIGVITFRSVGIMNSDGTPFMDIYYDCGCGFGATYAWKKLTEDIFLFLGALMIFKQVSYGLVIFPFRRSV